MHTLLFEPVTIEMKSSGEQRIIHSVEEAAEFLLIDWPARHGPTYLAAQKVCLDAMEGQQSIMDARAAFVEAAKTADIFVNGS
ncbi:DUF982 domain-containing protein (plasmid) [Phyllobacterium sp. 628]|uniref:DUF982 domain-containing protein n=1 Tax=Phyllobacterium sp. 628 TaxID=2718938 RepID=UPI0016621F82|nr:DUF982 domain-containing protein [Phyllobacterium sp. 628]QND54395.1 DUF982 domain-containing protein [Phyllobacterium sp. 628]